MITDKDKAMAIAAYIAVWRDPDVEQIADEALKEHWWGDCVGEEIRERGLIKPEPT